VNAREQIRPGSDAERRAARALARKLEDLGREVAVEPFEVWPRYPLAYALHALLGIVGSVLAVSAPVAGTVLVLAAVLLSFGEATGMFRLTRRLTGRRASQNVVSGEDADKPGTLVLVAHYDAGRTPHERLPAAFFWALVALLACCVARIAGLEGTALTAVQFVPTALLLVSLPLLGEIALSAGDNASGVATVLRLAERYGGTLDHFDVQVLLTGAALGMRPFLKRHRPDKQRTVFLNFDQVDAAGVGYTRKEGPLLRARSHVQLVEICDEIVEDDDGAFDARGRVGRVASDGYVARMAGYPSITISCEEAAFGFCCELIERLDAGIGPELDELRREEPVPAS
jgi:hypothetical protein